MKWALKIAAKLLLSRLPVPYGFWRSLGVFRHGRMDSAEQPRKIFLLHLNRAYPRGLPSGAVILELGPGDSAASAVIGRACGAERVYLVDVGNYASRNVAFYRSLADDLRRQGMSAPDLSGAVSFADVMRLCRAQYLTEGVESLRGIPAASVDFVWSHSVLEHVRKRELDALIRELRRVLRPGGLSSHNVDYQDHLDHALNNLRFSERAWESDLFANSGFYTNRVPAVTMNEMFRSAGFAIEQEDFGRWPSLPTPRHAMHSDFDRYRDADLMNRTSSVLLRNPR